MPTRFRQQLAVAIWERHGLTQPVEVMWLLDSGAVRLNWWGAAKALWNGGGE